MRISDWSSDVCSSDLGEDFTDDGWLLEPLEDFREQFGRREHQQQCDQDVVAVGRAGGGAGVGGIHVVENPMMMRSGCIAAASRASMDRTNQASLSSRGK